MPATPPTSDAGSGETAKPPPASLTIQGDDVVARAGSVRGISALGTYGAEAMSALNERLGFGWPATIAVSAVLIRASTFPFAWLHQLHKARAATVARDLAHAQQWIRRSPGTIPQRYRSWRHLRSVAFRSAGTNAFMQWPWYLAGHLPLVISASVGARMLASDPAAGWASAAPVHPWADVLALPDPSGAMPIATVALWVLNVHRGRTLVDKDKDERKKNEQVDEKKPLNNDALVKILSTRFSDWVSFGVQAIALGSLPYIMEVPSGVLLLWIANGTLNSMTRFCFSNDVTRSFVGLPTREEIESRARNAPNMVQAARTSMKSVTKQVEYVNNNVMPRFRGRRPDERLASDISRALLSEHKRGRITIRLVGDLRHDDNGSAYIAVVPESRKMTNKS